MSRKCRLTLRRYLRDTFLSLNNSLLSHLKFIPYILQFDGENETELNNCDKKFAMFGDFREKRKNGTYDMAARVGRNEGDDEKTKSVPGQIARRDVVRRHVTVTRAFQLIRNKRCQRQTDENRCRVQMLFIVKHVGNPRRMLFKRSSECYRDTCFMRIPGHGKFVRLSRQFWTHFISLAVIYRRELNGLYEH